jgi:hypothetical protein
MEAVKVINEKRKAKKESRQWKQISFETLNNLQAKGMSAFYNIKRRFGLCKAIDICSAEVLLIQRNGSSI